MIELLRRKKNVKSATGFQLLDNTLKFTGFNVKFIFVGSFRVRPCTARLIIGFAFALRIVKHITA